MEIQLDLPKPLAEEAEASGLLSSEAVAGLLRAELQRRRRKEFFEAADRLAAQDPPLTAEEIEAEIQAARAKRRASDESRS